MLLTAILVCVPVFVLPHINNKTDNTPKQDYAGLISMWHIENFEGGSFSRYQYLLRQMIELEKKHKGLLVSIKVLSAFEARNLVEQGHLPDLVSFGTGAGDVFLEHVIAYNGKLNIRQEFISSGTVGGKIKAVAYMSGGYFVMCNKTLIKEAGIDTQAELLDNVYKATHTYNKGKSIRYSLVTARADNIPLAALIKNSSKTAQENSVLWAENQFEAYNKFVTGSACILLGTQRDLHRVLNRISQNNFFEYDVRYLKGYTDLVQYLAITSKDQKRQETAQLIVQYLTDQSAQRNLTGVGMFSADGNNYYSAQMLKDMEASINQPLITPNAFTSSKKTSNLNDLTILAVKGDKTAQNRIKAEFDI